MAQDDATTGSKASWHEREITLALQRLANARAQLATLEEQEAGATIARPEPDAADLARATQLQADITKLTAKASGRFGASSARGKLEDCQVQLRQVLDRLGVDDLAELRSPFTDAGSAVDPTVLDFARRECADAEKAFLEVAAMVIPDVEPGADDDEAEADVIAATDSFAGDETELDLRIEPFAAS
jgi:hypothetical protein